MVASSFKAAGYRSARQYFSRARREHILRTHVAVPADVELAITDAFRSVERGIGGPALKDAFRAEEITLSFDTSDDRAAAALVVLGLWFLMREIEIASLLCKHFQLDEAKGTITMTLWASKTDSVGCLVSRTHKCYCSVVPKHICPFHVALLFAKDKPSEADSPLFPASGGGVLTKQETIDIIRSVLQKSEVPLTRPGAAGSEPVSRFHGHCLRVSGAQLLSRLRVPVSTIMLLGRWGSKSIERYIQEAELESFDISAQADGLDAVASLPKRPRLDNQSSGPAASATSVSEQWASQATLLPSMWRARCGWKYAGSRFLRVSSTSGKQLCKRCFPPADDVESGEEPGSETDESSSSSSSSQTSSGSEQGD